MILATLFLGVALQAGPASRTECLMNPQPIPSASIARNPRVRSYVQTPDRLSASVLLKDGTMMRIVNSGCDKSGGKVSAWMSGNGSQTGTRYWLREALTFARVAFRADIARDLEAAIKQEKFVTSEVPDSIFYASGRSSEFLMFTVLVKPVDGELILSVSYVLG